MNKENFRFYIGIMVQDASTDAGNLGGVGQGLHLSLEDLRSLSSDTVMARLKSDYEASRNDMLSLVDKTIGK